MVLSPLDVQWFDLNEAEESFANKIIKQQGINFIIIIQKHSIITESENRLDTSCTVVTYWYNRRS